jgi:hypothetical protein
MISLMFLMDRSREEERMLSWITQRAALTDRWSNLPALGCVCALCTSVFKRFAFPDRRSTIPGPADHFIYYVRYLRITN